MINIEPDTFEVLPYKVQEFMKRLEKCECTDIRVILIGKSNNYSVRCTLPAWYPCGTDNVRDNRHATWTFVMHNQKFQGEYKRPQVDKIENAKRFYEKHGHPSFYWPYE